MNTESFNRMTHGVLLLSAIMLWGCEGLAVHNTSSLLIPRFQRSEVLGFVAGFGTTFAAVPDLIAMFKRRSSKGMNPTMAGIMGRLSNCLGLLRPLDCVATGDCVERGCRGDQFSERWGILSLRPLRAQASSSV